jgi:predicted nucleic acid-binding protein
MILIDSSVWIDYFRGSATRQTDKLEHLLGEEPLAVGDLILIEVLQGFPSERDFRDALALLENFDWIPIGGTDVAVAAAINHRRLMALGITPRKTIDTAIATRCIVSGHALLHDDRDFDAFEQHLGLTCV